MISSETIQTGPKLTHEVATTLAGVFRTAILEHDELIIDCTELDQLDGSGVGTLALTLHSAWLDGKLVRVDNIGGQPRELLDALGILDFFETYGR